MNTTAAEAIEKGIGEGPWFAVQVKPNCSTIAERNLLRQGFDIFAPFEQVSVRSGRQFKPVRRSLFPGYIFVGFDPVTAPWRAINGTYGVARLISTRPDVPTAVPYSLISNLAACCDASGRYVAAPSLAAGDKVQIVDGPLAELIATVDKIMPQRRIWLLLELLGSTTRVEMNMEDVRLAP